MLLDFLLFKRFLSIPVLIAFYYIGALLIPLLSWLLLQWLLKKSQVLNNTKNLAKLWFNTVFSLRQKVLLFTGFIFGFLLMELFWRMLFEFLIAYLQMREALVVSL